MDEASRIGRLRSIIGRGRVTLVDDGAGAQRLQIDVGPIGPDGQSMGLRDNTIRAAEYGFFSVPPLNCDVIVLSVDGDLSNAVIVATNDQASRPTGHQPGDSGVYSVHGNLIVLSADGISITPAAGQKVTINSDVVITGDAEIGGISFAEHKHPDVQTGSDESGAPVA